MKTLIADISNGRTKLVLAEGRKLVSEVRVIPTAEICESRLAETCAGWNYAAAAFSSVVPAASKLFCAYTRQCSFVGEVKCGEQLPVDFSGYPGITTLGADRAANAVAAAALYPGVPLWVVDAGTAITADVILPAEQEGGKARFLGGMIAPGPGTMLRLLHKETAQLPVSPAVLPERAVGRNTQEALQSGCVRGCCGILRELWGAMAEECGCALQPVITGGDAPLLSQAMPELGIPHPLLTLQGIALCADAMRKC